MFHDHPSRSPNSHRQQPTLHRQASAHFDAYNSIPGGLYDDPTSRYETARLDRLAMQPSYAYDLSAAQTWNPGPFGGAHTLGSLGAGAMMGRTRPSARARNGLPSTWLDPAISNPYAISAGSAIPPHVRHENSQDGDDELIPTAIVIKNIPFAVKKEQLVQLMTDMHLPLPYAFNYHFDNGVFRGLAFANFTSAEETAAVIEMLNHFELQGRKLRVEYKKMLPLQERERIEREKRERRGQLEEQHRPIAPSQLHSQPSLGSLSSHIPVSSPSPVSQRGKLDVDMNDAETLQFYSQLLLFKQDLSREVFIFPSTLSPPQRRTVHTLAHNLGLSHLSRGSGEQRQVHVYRSTGASNLSPSASANPATIHPGDSRTRGLNRAATIDFSESRGEAGPFATLRNNSLLNVFDPSFGTGPNLRAAKSFADLRSYSPSPAPSTASFPAALQTNGVRMQQFDGNSSASANSSTPTMTPSVTAASLGSIPRDDLLVNPLGNLSLGTNIGGPTSGSPRRLRSMFSWEADSSPPPAATAPIGSNRTVGVGFDETR